MESDDEGMENRSLQLVGGENVRGGRSSWRRRRVRIGREKKCALPITICRSNLGLEIEKQKNRRPKLKQEALLIF